MARGLAQKYLSRLAKVLPQQYAAGRLAPVAASDVASVVQSGEAGNKTSQSRYSAMPATQVAPKTHVEPSVVPEVQTDAFGAVSVVDELMAQIQPGVYKNMDGHRFDDGRYKLFTEEVKEVVSEGRIYTDPVRTFAYGTDASFYRLNPKMVLKVHNEAEIRKLLPIARKHQVPVTFRAAGTSLSGQAITDSVLLKISHTGRNFRNYEVHGDGSTITVEPGLIGGEVNRILAAHKKKHNHPVQYKIGPDPSSIDSCMIGGIVANNSSGMCCGVSQNTYHTLADMRVVMADGTVLDTADAASRESFLQTHKHLVDGVVELARRVQADRNLCALIRRKFAIKCTTGYSLNALVDFPLDNPIEIVKRLMIGSEGTLGFVSRATYNTVPEWPHKASAFIVFPDVRSACTAAAVLRRETAVDAVELFDRVSLRDCSSNEDMVGMVPEILEADPMAAALLIECRGQDAEALKTRIDQVNMSLERAALPFGAKADDPKTLSDYAFRHSPKECNVFWDVRKGLIPIVGGARETGTSMLIEDVACPVDKLADMIIDLAEMFQKYGYKDASCFGHALEGNLHLVFAQGFRSAEEVQRFSDVMDEMSYIVATKHSGSLKGEHSTGRNMAPYVEMEWGTKAYELMWELKELFDPDMVLNPGVILNRDPNIHKKWLKASPPASPIVNRCIECGFCESNCPSRDVTITPRQRITVYRELSRLRGLPALDAAQQERKEEMEKIFSYAGDATCAADGMCQEKCPVKINTGELVKSLRAEQMETWKTASSMSMGLANHFEYINWGVPKLLNVVDAFHRVLGPWPLQTISNLLNKATSNYMPAWNPYMPRGAAPLAAPEPPSAAEAAGIPRKVVYVPSCVTRMMGPSLSDPERQSVHEKLLSLFEKANYEVIYPEKLSSLCCGMLFNSRGFKEAAASKGVDLEQALMAASEGGKYPVVCDTSPCLSQVKGQLSESALRFALYEPVEFIRHFLMDKLEWRQVKDTIAVHVPCSSKKMGIESAFLAIAEKCAKNVVPSGIPCCGMAGDRGMRYPELTGSSLQHLNLPQDCSDGYSTSRTCEMSLSNHSGVNFRSMVYLVDAATTAKPTAKAAASVS